MLVQAFSIAKPPARYPRGARAAVPARGCIESGDFHHSAKSTRLEQAQSFKTYRALLNQIYIKHRLRTADAWCEYLESLQDTAASLWKSYRTPNITTDYSNPKLQEVYLLRYFVHYSHLLSQVLGFMQCKGMELLHPSHSLDAHFYGCGPGPEVVGLLRHLKQSVGANPPRLNIQMLDECATTWAHVRDMVGKGLIADMWPANKLAVQNIATNITVGHSFQSSAADLVVFQNCLNELSMPELQTVERKLNTLLQQAKPGATLVIIERANYPQTQQLLQRLHTRANNDSQLCSIGSGQHVSRMPCHSLPDQPPEIVLNHLFKPGHSGLQMAGSIKYHWLAIQKVA